MFLCGRLEEGRCRKWLVAWSAIHATQLGVAPDMNHGDIKLYHVQTILHGWTACAVQLLGTRPSTSVCTLSCPSLQDKWVGQSQKRPARTTTTTSSMGGCCNTSALTKNKQEDPQIKLATLWAWLTACGHVWWRVGYFFKVPSAASLHSTRYRSDLKPEISQQQQQQLLYNMLKELASAWELLKFRYQVSSTLWI